MVTSSTGPSSAASRSRARSTGTAVTVRSGGFASPRGAREQAQVVVDQPPALPLRQAFGHRPQGRAEPAGEIDHRDRRALARPGGDRVEHRRVARAPVVGLAQRQPASTRIRSYGPLDRPGEQLGRSAPGRKLRGGARAPAASFSRSSRIFDQPAQRRGERRRRRPGGTRTPACAGTVSGIAPAVVPITGRP